MAVYQNFWYECPWSTNSTGFNNATIPNCTLSWSILYQSAALALLDKHCNSRSSKCKAVTSCQPDRTAKQSNQDPDLTSVWFRSLDFLPRLNRQPPQPTNIRKKLGIKMGQIRGNTFISALILDKTLRDDNWHVLLI